MPTHLLDDVHLETYFVCMIIGHHSLKATSLVSKPLERMQCLIPHQTLVILSSWHEAAIEVGALRCVWVSVNVNNNLQRKRSMLTRGLALTELFHRLLPNWPSARKQRRMGVCTSQKHMTHLCTVWCRFQQGCYHVKQPGFCYVMISRPNTQRHESWKSAW